MTPIEHFLFHGQNLAHWILNIQQKRNSLLFTLAPLGKQNPKSFALFNNVKNITKNFYDPETTSFPWHIIGIESESKGLNRWNFGFVGQGIEYCFDADWPVIQKYQTFAVEQKEGKS